MASEATTSSKSILLIEDDKELCAMMADYFGCNGFNVELAHDGRTGLALAMKNASDLIILDVMLPVLDGFEVLRQIRKQSAIPVIVLTARAAQGDRIAGLDSGADDYLPKPFEPEELLARVRAVLRRTGAPDCVPPQIIKSGALKLNLQTHEMWNNDVLVELTSIEFDIMELLVRAAGRAVNRDELAAVLYRRSLTPYERPIDVHISHLRKKLEDPGPILIKTVRGVGYLLALRQGKVR